MSRRVELDPLKWITIKGLSFHLLEQLGVQGFANGFFDMLRIRERGGGYNLRSNLLYGPAPFVLNSRLCPDLAPDVARGLTHSIVVRAVCHRTFGPLLLAAAQI